MRKLFRTEGPGRPYVCGRTPTMWVEERHGSSACRGRHAWGKSLQSSIDKGLGFRTDHLLWFHQDVKLLPCEESKLDTCLPEGLPLLMGFIRHLRRFIIAD